MFGVGSLQHQLLLAAYDDFVASMGHWSIICDLSPRRPATGDCLFTPGDIGSSCQPATAIAHFCWQSPQCKRTLSILQLPSFPTIKQVLWVFRTPLIKILEWPMLSEPGRVFGSRQQDMCWLYSICNMLITVNYIITTIFIVWRAGESR